MRGCVMCDENKLEEKNDAYWSNFVVKDFKDMSLKDHIGRVGGWIKMILSRIIQHNMKVLVQC